MNITHRQRAALDLLKSRHDQYPNQARFAAVHLGANAAAMLRKLEGLGLVAVHRSPSHSGFFYAITPAGRNALDGGKAEAVEAERERCARIVERGLGRTNTAIARAIREGEE